MSKEDKNKNTELGKSKNEEINKNNLDFNPEEQLPEFEEIPSIMKQFMFKSITSNSSHPLVEKLTESHLSEIIGSIEKDSKREFDNSNRNRIFVVVLLAIILGFVIVLSLIFSDKNFVEKILTILVSFVSGLFAGGGLSLYIDNKKK